MGNPRAFHDTGTVATSVSVSGFRTVCLVLEYAGVGTEVSPYGPSRSSRFTTRSRRCVTLELQQSLLAKLPICLPERVELESDQCSERQSPYVLVGIPGPRYHPRCPRPTKIRNPHLHLHRMGLCSLLGTCRRNALCACRPSHGTASGIRIDSTLPL